MSGSRVGQKKEYARYRLDPNIAELSPIEITERVSRGASHLLALIMFSPEVEQGVIQVRKSITAIEAAKIALPAQGWSVSIFRRCFKELIAAGFLHQRQPQNTRTKRRVVN